MPTEPGGGRLVLVVARGELQQQLRDGLLRLAGLLMLVLLVASALAGWSQYSRDLVEGKRFTAEVRAQWLDQGEKHPHRAAHFGSYVVKPEMTLALFEPGLKPFAGRTLWLEAHSRSAFSYAPADDDVSAAAGLGLSSGAAMLQLLGGLLVLVTAALTVVREREAGTLRQILAQGIEPRAWLAGKYLGVAAALALAFAPLALGLTMVLVVLAPEPARVDVAARVGLSTLGNAFYFLALLGVGLTLSTIARSSRTALVLALGFWVTSGVLAPRVASHLATSLEPVPTVEAFQTAIGEDFEKGYDGEPGWDTRLDQLEARTLERYQVRGLDDLPVGFSGLRMRAMDGWTNQVADRRYAELEQVYESQARWRSAVAILAPFIAARNFSQGMAGMDWPHYRHFANRAELYRRSWVERLNQVLEQSLRGETWEMDAGRETWASVPEFRYVTPSVGWALAQQAGAFLILLGWAVGGAALLFVSGARLKP